jgi:Tfp pilus assembly protein PilN
MRPINLIPTEERRSRGAAARSGPLPYLIVGALALLLVGVLMLIHVSNQVSGRESQVSRLEVTKSEATAQAAALTPFASFAQVTEQRTNTIAELANARFDWSRVIQQLSLIIPPDVYFTSLNGSAGASEESGVVGPSLSITGCAPSQDAVAGFVATLKQIDGVTRTSLENSTAAEGAGEGEGEVSGASACAVGGKTQFSILVAFDLAPASPDGAAPEEVETESTESSSESEPPAEETETSSPETEGSSEGESTSTQSATTAGEGAAG